MLVLTINKRSEMRYLLKANFYAVNLVALVSRLLHWVVPPASKVRDGGTID
jgi:hypothetical protein